MLWFIFWVRKVTFHSVCMYVHVILLHCFPSLVFILNLNDRWTNTFSRNFTDEKKKERHFIWVCMFCFHESCLLRTILLCLQLEMGLTFYVVIQAMWRSSRLQSKGSTIPSFLSLISDAEYWSDPWGWTRALYFTALNAPEPRKFVKGSKYSL